MDRNQFPPASAGKETPIFSEGAERRPAPNSLRALDPGCPYVCLPVSAPFALTASGSLTVSFVRRCLGIPEPFGDETLFCSLRKRARP